tara:strand:- start:420 stop:614 length:195 start_codon:yes stop_codon:yes gene_type:complete
MSSKLKPSSKEYVKDSTGKFTNKWVLKHYTAASYSDTALIEALSKLPRKKGIILKELDRRGVSI